MSRVLITIFVMLMCNLTFDLNAQLETCKWQKFNLFDYDDILSEKYARVRYDNEYGIIDKNGDTIIAPKYTEIYYHKAGFFICYNKGRWGLLNENLDVILEEKYSSIKVFSKGIQAISKSKLYFFDYNGKLSDDKIFSKYYIHQESEDLLVASADNKNTGIMDRSGKWLFPIENAYYDISNSKYIIRQRDFKRDIFDRLGQKINKTPFFIINIYGEYFIARKDNVSLYNIYSNDGNPINSINPFDDYSFEMGFLVTRDGIKERVYDIDLVQKFECDVQKNDGLYLSKIHFITPCGLSDTAVYFSSGENGRETLYKNFKPISAKNYNRIELYNSNFIARKNDGIDILNNQGESVKTFSPNIALFFSKNRLSYIKDSRLDSIYFYDENRYIPIEKCNGIIHFDGNFFFTSNFGRLSLYDTKGNLITKDVKDFEEHSLTFECYFLEYTKNNKKGWIHKDKNVLPQYDQIEFISEELVLVFTNNKWKIVRTDGSVYDKRAFDFFEDCGNGIILKEGENYGYVSKVSNKFFELGLLSDYKKGNAMLALKLDNNWRIYCQIKDTLFQNEFDTITFDYKLLKTEKGNFLIDYLSSTLTKLDFDTSYSQSYTVIGVKDHQYFVRYIDYETNNTFSFKRFDCDSLKYENYKLLIYKDAKISLYNMYEDFYYFKDADSIILYDQFNKYIAKYGDHYDVYWNQKKIATIEGTNISLAVNGSLILFKNKENNIIYDINLDSTFIKQYDRYSSFDKGIFLVENNFLTGALDKYHNEIIPCLYDKINIFRDDRYLEVVKDKQRALLDRNGKICIPLDNYTDAFTYSRNLIFVKKGEYHGVYNISEDKWYPASKYQDIKDCNIRLESFRDIFTFHENGFYGLMDENCNVVLSPEYEEIKVEERIFILKKEKEKYVFFPETNRLSTKSYFQIIVHLQYWLGENGDTLELFKNDKLLKTFYGYFPGFNYQQNLFEYTFDNTEDFESRVILYDLDQMKELFEHHYTKIDILYNGNFIVCDTSENCKLVDRKEQQIYHKIFSDYKLIGLDKVGIKVNGKYGVIDTYGKELLAPSLDQFEILNESKGKNYNIKNKGKIDVFDEDFKLLFSGEFDFIGNFNSGLAPVRKGQNWGYADYSGNINIPLIYDYCGEFNDYNYEAIVVKNSTFFKINTLGTAIEHNGSLTIDLNKYLAHATHSNQFNMEKYNQVSFTPNQSTTEFIKVKDKKSNKYGVVDIMFNEVIPIVYDDIFGLPSSDYPNIYVYRLNDKYGLMGKSGRTITDALYDKIDDYNRKNVKASKDGLTIILDYAGNEIK